MQQGRLVEYAGNSAGWAWFLDRVVRVVKLLGLVNAGSGFTQHPLEHNGCSELLKDVFGEDCGVGTRSAFGVSGLPAGAMVEIEGVFQIKE